MSEPLFPAPGGVAPPPAEPVTEPTSNRKVLMVLGAVGAVLVAGAGAFFLMNSGGSSEEAPFVAQPRSSASAPAPKPTPAPTAKVVIRTANVSVTSRDPFKPLFPSPTATPTATPSAAPSSAPAPVATTPSGPTGGSVTLGVTGIDVVAQTAVVTVDGKKYATPVNKVFAKYFTMYSVFNSTCVGILYGDQSIPVCTTKPQRVSP